MPAPKTLPRLKAEIATHARKPERRTVDLPTLGASVVIEQPTMADIITVQEGLPDNVDGATASKAMVLLAIVEPKMETDYLDWAINGGWPPGDWMILVNEVNDLTGMGEVASRAARAAFPKS